MTDEEIRQAREFARSLNMHATREAVAAQWIDALVDRLEWAQDEICALRDREDARV
jgi:hypothetical protein